MTKGAVREIIIVDPNRKRVEGEVMDLLHGKPYMEPVTIMAGDYSNIKGSELVVITAGMKQKPGQTRLELVHENAKLFQ